MIGTIHKLVRKSRSLRQKTGRAPDADELAAWVATAPEPPGTTYVVHGEKAAAAALRARLASDARGTVVVPSPGERVRLD